MQGYQVPLAIALAVGIAATAYAQPTEQVLKLPDQIEWKAPPMVGGASTAILFGDPSKPGVYVTRTKFPAGLKTMPHTHPDEWRTVVVLSGTHYFGLGDTWDESKFKAYPTGTFFSEPKDTPHFVWAGDCVAFTLGEPQGNTCPNTHLAAAAQVWIWHGREDRGTATTSSGIRGYSGHASGTVGPVGLDPCTKSLRSSPLMRALGSSVR
jgi:quercetin dioxygenase-like cupin family protein